MDLAPSVENYMYGKGVVMFRAHGAEGYLHLGNCPAFGLQVGVEQAEHFSSMSGTKEKDAAFVTQKSATGNVTMEEFNAENVAIAFLGDVMEGSQASKTLSGHAVAVTPGRYVDLGMKRLGITRIMLAGGTGDFSVGETVTGDASSASGSVAWAEPGLVELVGVTGVFKIGENVTGDTSSASATASGVERAADVVVTDAAESPTTRYKSGVDYMVVAEGGMLTVAKGGAAGSAETVYVSADVPALKTHKVDALTNAKCEGELLFIGQPEQGPRWHVRMWRASLKLSGEIGMISDDAAQMQMSIEGLADRGGHPASPFFEAVKIDNVD